MSVVLRLKRKASTEPVEGLMVALKKSKFDDCIDKSEVFFKFAVTLNSEKDSVKDQIQAVLLKDKHSRPRDPKSSAIAKSNVRNISDRLKKENKAASEKKRLDLLNSRRLILSETLPIDELDQDSENPSVEVRKLFQLYDIIEENEEIKKQVEETESTITCNDELLVRERPGDYVYDVYISDAKIDHAFVEHPVCVRPCAVIDDDLYSGGSDDSNEAYEDEDDSNDENNWRNDYPEDERSTCSENDSNEEPDDYGSHNVEHHRVKEFERQFDHLHVDSSYDEDAYYYEDYNISSKDADFTDHFSD